MPTAPAPLLPLGPRATRPAQARRPRRVAMPQHSVGAGLPRPRVQRHPRWTLADHPPTPASTHILEESTLGFGTKRPDPVRKVRKCSRNRPGACSEMGLFAPQNPFLHTFSASNGAFRAPKQRLRSAPHDARAGPPQAQSRALRLRHLPAHPRRSGGGTSPASSRPSPRPARSGRPCRRPAPAGRRACRRGSP